MDPATSYDQRENGVRGSMFGSQPNSQIKNHLQACIMKPIEVTKGKHWHAVFRGANLWGYEKTTTMQLSLQALLCQLH
jgi:hypothetical protein